MQRVYAERSFMFIFCHARRRVFGVFRIDSILGWPGRNVALRDPFRTSIVAAVLIGLVYRDGGNNREGFGELTMANVPNSSER